MPFTPYPSPATEGDTPKDFTPYTPPAKKNASAALSASGAMLTAYHQINDAAQGSAKGAIEGLMDVAGGLAKGGEAIETGISDIPGLGGLKENIGKGAEQIAEAQKAPVLQAKNAGEARGEVLGEAADAAIPLEKAGDAIGIGEKAAAGVKKVSAMAEKVASVVKAKAVDPIESALAPRLTAKVAEKEGASDPQGLLGNIQRNVSAATKRLTQTVKDAVPDFGSKKTFTEKANAVEQANTKEAQSLEQSVAANNHPYTYTELNSKIGSLEKPELIKTGDATVQKLYESARTKMMSLARKNGGDLSGLLKARKDFYAWTNKEYKNLWGSDSITAAREGIGAIANEVNEFIANGAEAAQKGAGDAFRASLKKQSDLFDAEDLLREKAARGAPKVQGEVGTNRIDRFATDHPKATKAAGATAAIVGTGLVGGEVVKHL